MKVKTKDNVRNTRYGLGYTSAEVALMTIANLAGAPYSVLKIMVEYAARQRRCKATRDGRRVGHQRALGVR